MMKCIILAGGYATRLWPITENRPKPALPIGSQSIIGHIIDNVPAEIPIIISTNEAFKDSFQEIIASKKREIIVFVEPSYSDKGKRGTLAAISDSIQFGGSADYLVIGGDNFFDFSLHHFLQKAKERPDKPLIAGFDIGHPVHARKFGVIEADGDTIIGFEEKPKQPKSTLVSTLCYYLPGAIAEHIHDAAEALSDEAGKLFPFLMERGITCYTHVVAGIWSDIGSFTDYITTHRMLGRSSVTREHKSQNTLQGSNYIHPSTGVHNSKIIDSIILENCEITNSYLEGCIVNSGSVIQNQTCIGQSISKELNLT